MIDKKSLSESDIYTKFITPVLEKLVRENNCRNWRKLILLAEKYMLKKYNAKGN